MKKRYAITMDEETHRLLTIKAVRSGQTVGDILAGLTGREATVDEVKKAIEPEKVRQEPRGRLSKGLGEVPGLTDVGRESQKQTQRYKDSILNKINKK